MRSFLRGTENQVGMNCEAAEEFFKILRLLRNQVGMNCETAEKALGGNVLLTNQVGMNCEKTSTIVLGLGMRPESRRKELRDNKDTRRQTR